MVTCEDMWGNVVTSLTCYLMRVPIAVKDDNGVSRLEIEAQPTGASAEQKEEIIRLLVVEFYQELASIICLGGTVQAQVAVT